jgi:hypothetical protein
MAVLDFGQRGAEKRNAKHCEALPEKGIKIHFGE